VRRWLSTILAAIMLFAVVVPAAGAVESGSAPVLVGADSTGEAYITLTFDKPLTAKMDEGYAPALLDYSKFALSGADGITIQYAEAQGHGVLLGLSNRLGDIQSVTLGMAAGAVTSSTGIASAAVTGYKIQTLAGKVAILAAMNAQNANPTVSEIVKYARSAGSGNVAGAPGIGSEDIRFLMTLLDSQEGKANLAEALGLANAILNNTEYAHVTGDLRTELETQLQAAQQTLNAPGSVLYDYGVAQLALAEAYDAFIRFEPPVEPGMTATVDNLIVDGSLLRLDVRFSEDVSSETRSLGAAELIEQVTVIGMAGPELWLPENISTDWTDAQTLEISFNGGAAAEYVAILIDFVDGAVTGSSGAPLDNDFASYYVDVNIVAAWIENVEIANHVMMSFDIRFSGGLSSETLAKATAAELFADMMLLTADGETSVGMSALEVEWIGDDLLRVAAPNGLSGEWLMLVVGFQEAAITGANGEELVQPGVIYIQPPTELTAEITAIHGIEAVSIYIEFSEPVSSDTQTKPAIDLLDSVKLVNGEEYVFTPQKYADVTAVLDGWR